MQNSLKGCLRALDFLHETIPVVEETQAIRLRLADKSSYPKKELNEWKLTNCQAHFLRRRTPIRPCGARSARPVAAGRNFHPREPTPERGAFDPGWHAIVWTPAMRIGEGREFPAGRAKSR